MRIEEQKRLAHEMHDDFGQMLTAMKIDLFTLQKHLAPQNSEVVKYLESINDLVDAMVTSVRRIIADLPPKILEDLGLFDALISIAQKKKW
jgi:signal transduction histidine kinase